MVETKTPEIKRGWEAAPFTLKGTDGHSYSLESVRGPKGLVVMFICNHCPFVQAIAERIERDISELKTYGVGAIAIMPNDVTQYPADSIENMKIFAEQHHFDFPYVIDETQEVAHAYGAVCTPDFFGFNGDLKLQYRGRLDGSGREPKANANRDLFDAMAQIAETGKGPDSQFNSVGCSIKWKNKAA